MDCINLFFLIFRLSYDSAEGFFCLERIVCLLFSSDLIILLTFGPKKKFRNFLISNNRFCPYHFFNGIRVFIDKFFSLPK